jgi:hypothetical protein
MNSICAEKSFSLFILLVCRMLLSVEVSVVRYWFFLGGALSFLASTSVVALDSVEERLSVLEREMQQVSVENCSGSLGARFATARATYEYYFDAEVLLWHAKAGGVAWSILYDQAVYPIKGKMNTLGFGWDWGFRLGVGTYFKYDGWDLGLLYTYFNTSDSSQVAVNFQTPVGTGGSGSLQSPFGSAQGSFSAKFFYNALDVSLGRWYFITKDVEVHPHMGLKNIWLDQKTRFTQRGFINANNTSLGVIGTLNTALKDRDDVWGIGPHIGMDGLWHLGGGFECISAVEGALLQSYFKVTQTETLYIAPVGSTALGGTGKMKGSIHQFVPYARLQLGLGWSRSIKEDQQRVRVNLTYETNYFWRINQTISNLISGSSTPSFRSTDSLRVLFDRDSEDICFYGVTFKCAIDF